MAGRCPDNISCRFRIHVSSRRPVTCGYGQSSGRDVGGFVHVICRLLLWVGRRWWARRVRGGWQSVLVDIDAFWVRIEECRRQARGREERLAWLREELACESLREIVQFQVCLDQVTRDAFTWDLWAAAERIFGGWCSDDGFCYFGLWMVGLGRDAFERVVADPDALAQVPEVLRLVGRSRDEWNDDWPGWESLDYVALEAYEQVVGGVDGCGEGFYEAVAAERVGGAVPRGPAGERWDVRGEEAARRLPTLSNLFPIHARS